MEDPERASDALPRALSLWRGHAYADIEANGRLDLERRVLAIRGNAKRRGRRDDHLEAVAAAERGTKRARGNGGLCRLQRCDQCRTSGARHRQ